MLRNTDQAFNPLVWVFRFAAAATVKFNLTSRRTFEPTPTSEPTPAAFPKKAKHLVPPESAKFILLKKKPRKEREKREG